VNLLRRESRELQFSGWLQGGGKEGKIAIQRGDRYRSGKRVAERRKGALLYAEGKNRLPEKKKKGGGNVGGRPVIGGKRNQHENSP